MNFFIKLFEFTSNAPKFGLWPLAIDVSVFIGHNGREEWFRRFKRVDCGVETWRKIYGRCSAYIGKRNPIWWKKREFLIPSSNQSTLVSLLFPSFFSPENQYNIGTWVERCLRKSARRQETMLQRKNGWTSFRMPLKPTITTPTATLLTDLTFTTQNYRESIMSAMYDDKNGYFIVHQETDLMSRCK